MESKPQLAFMSFGQTSPNIPKISELSMDKVFPNPDQPRQRFNEESLRELAASIERHGLLQPVTVKRSASDPDQYMLVAGERRYRAHQLLGRDKIPGIVLTSGNTDELALIENLQREDLNPIEEAEALGRLKERYQYTQEDLGRVVGKAQNTISTLLRLNSLPEQIKREYPTSDTVAKSVLVEIARHEDSAEQLKLWDIAKAGKATVRTARTARKENKEALAGNAADGVPAALGQALNSGRALAKHLESIGQQGLNWEASPMAGLDEAVARIKRLDIELCQDDWQRLSRLAQPLADFLNEAPAPWNKPGTENPPDGIAAIRQLRDQLEALLRAYEAG